MFETSVRKFYFCRRLRWDRLETHGRQTYASCSMLKIRLRLGKSVSNRSPIKQISLQCVSDKNNIFVLLKLSGLPRFSRKPLKLPSKRCFAELLWLVELNYFVRVQEVDDIDFSPDSSKAASISKDRLINSYLFTSRPSQLKNGILKVKL